MPTSEETLTTLVTAYLEQDDIVSRIPDFIMLAELRIGREVRVRQLQKSITPVAIPAGGKLALPSDFIEISSHMIQATTPWRPEYVPEAQFVALASNSVQGIPKAYTLVGEEIWFSSPPDSATYMYEMNYYAYPETIIGGGANWIATNVMDIYLYATLLEAEPYIINDARMATWKGLYDSAKISMMQMSRRGVNRPGGTARSYAKSHPERRGRYA